MLLSKVKIQDFKRIREAELSLSDVNVLVGANGSGKSSIIQALHLSACLLRQADRVDATKTSTVGIEQLDYLPTDDYSMLGHNTLWGNRAGSPSSKAEFTFTKDDSEVIARCELRSARNAGISITGQVPSELTTTLRAKQRFFSAYIPGISGVPNKEEKRARKIVLKACSYGDSNVILRNVLLLLKQEGQIALVEAWISQIIGDIKLHVDHDENHDLHIDSSVELNGLKRPIELTGTGFLQLIQLFSYILLFKPGILLVDEPDIHLHPSVQERLVRVLASVAKERQLRVLLTTHSPFVVRGAPPGTNVYWVKDGTLEAVNREEIELALGWGAFGKKVLIISEDTETALLRKLIAQWPHIDRLVAFHPGTGYKALPSPQQAADLCRALGGKFKILVHRDRDSLTDDEVEAIVRRYAESGIHLWFPDQSDVEAYFCHVQFLAELICCSQTDASDLIEDVLRQQKMPIQDQFCRQRSAHNRELHETGGSPTNEDVWVSSQNRLLRGAKGKFVFKQLKGKVPGGKFSEAAIEAHKIVGELAPTLRLTLTSLVGE
jgi:predicted ATPase